MLAGVGGWLLHRADDGATRRHVMVDGVQLDEVHPPTTPGARRPGVVVAHGFAGSSRLMAQFGDSLAARGYVVVLPDFSGHGADTGTLPDGSASTDATTAALQRDLDVAAAHLRSLPDVDPARIALVGHSMGASAVTRYAAGHPGITATVAISLPSAETVQPDRPSRLLLLVGAWEFPAFRDEAALAARPAGPTRSLVVVPRVEHISVLYAPRTHAEVTAWLDAGFGGPPDDRPAPSPTRRLAGGGLLLLALLIGFHPLSRALLGGSPGTHPRTTWRQIGRTAVVAGAASILAAPVAALLPTRHLGIGGYIIGFTATAGALMLAYQRLRRGPLTAATPRSRPVAAAPVLIGYAAVTIAVPVHAGVTHAVPVGARWWLLLLVWAGFALLAYAGERVAGGNSFGVLTVSAVSVIALTGAAVAGLTFAFVLLVVPLLAVLLVVQAGWSAVLNRVAAPPWLTALVGSLLVAWPIATTLPVIG